MGMVFVSGLSIWGSRRPITSLRQARCITVTRPLEKSSSKFRQAMDWAGNAWENPTWNVYKRPYNHNLGRSRKKTETDSPTLAHSSTSSCWNGSNGKSPPSDGLDFNGNGTFQLETITSLQHGVSWYHVGIIIRLTDFSPQRSHFEPQTVQGFSVISAVSANWDPSFVIEIYTTSLMDFNPYPFSMDFGLGNPHWTVGSKWIQ